MEFHPEYKFSVTVYVDDAAVLACLRGLAWYCQQTGNKQISWGGTKRNEWIANGRKAKFHFNNPDYRENFISELQRFFRKVKVEDQSDDDPAPRRGSAGSRLADSGAQSGSRLAGFRKPDHVAH